ncbi:MAG: S-adenosyl-L-methionine hydrolase (adenosine-forming) [Desulfobacteraceae bacterium Eth-SRB2]|nr:MAG: S-adenosyl-L-methionine hydrolase (adenosine-forming) [Desulfobacteraceae bacterium Eth-SRB2]
MSIITLLTDFGTEDAYVGMMKGVILSIHPQAVIIDITHHIDPQNVIQAAYIIKSSYKYFPEGTVHLLVVDPGVGSDRSIVALEMMGHIFLAPDNGVLTLLMDEGETDSIVSVENTRYFLESVSRTFHGRDIFAPVGAHLCRGLDIKNLGSPLDQQNLVQLKILKPYISENSQLVGTVVWFDHFGNCISNIDAALVKKMDKSGSEKMLEIKIGKNTIKGVSLSYADTEPKNPLAIIGGLGYLEIALNKGNAKLALGIEKGEPITLTQKPE